MDTVPRAYIEATERLAGKREAVERMHEHVRQRTVRFLDDQSRIQQRVDRLLANPAVNKALRIRGVADELATRPVDSLSPRAQSELERVIGGVDFMPVWFLTRGAELRRTVVKVKARTRSGRVQSGTGFMVGPRLMLTNYHVLDWTDAGAQSLDEIAPLSVVEFDFEEQYDGIERNKATFRLQPETLLLASPWNILDYVLVAVEPKNLEDGSVRIEEFGYNRLAADQGKISTGEPVFLIQHPNGAAKQVVVRNNRLIERDEAGSYLAYEADTQGGSSGAPVFNRQWEVVALHHATQIARDGEGRILARDGGLWEPGLGSAGVKYLDLNEGVRISRVLNDLTAKCEVARGTAGLMAPETCTPEGVALLQKALQFSVGVSPAVIAAPVGVQPRETVGVGSTTGSPHRPGGFPRPD